MRTLFGSGTGLGVGVTDGVLVAVAVGLGEGGGVALGRGVAVVSAVFLGYFRCGQKGGGGRGYGRCIGEAAGLQRDHGRCRAAGQKLGHRDGRGPAGLDRRRQRGGQGGGDRPNDFLGQPPAHLSRQRGDEGRGQQGQEQPGCHNDPGQKNQELAKSAEHRGILYNKIIGGGFLMPDIGFY